MKNKKAVDILSENLVFLILILVFAFVLGLSIIRIESNTALYEKIYAKQLALLINKAEAGMEIEMDITRLNNIAKKNKFDGKIIDIDNNERKINIKLINGKGYDFYFFSDKEILWNLKKEERKLFLRVIEKNEN